MNDKHTSNVTPERITDAHNNMRGAISCLSEKERTFIHRMYNLSQQHFFVRLYPKQESYFKRIEVKINAARNQSRQKRKRYEDSYYTSMVGW